MDFKKWILSLKNVNQSIGELAQDIEWDSEFPRTNDYTVLLNYLRAQKASPDILDAFETSYRFFRGDQKK